MELKDFMEELIEKAKLYDFREEIIKFKDTDDSLKRFVDYKAIGVRDNGNKEGQFAYQEIEKVYKSYENNIISKSEADNCNLIRKIYEELWSGTESMTGDSMNSVFTSLYIWFRYQYNCSTHNLGLKKEAGYWGRRSNRKLIGLYYDNCNQPWFENALTEEVRKFLKVSYTIGNFIPVPRGCNGPRGIGKIKDYWDLTLKAIYDYYVCDENSRKYKIYTLEDVFGKDKNRLCRLKKWLDSFSDDNSNKGNCKWKDFVEKNYMQDFVNPNPDGSYGMPKELWEGHFKGEVLPEGDQCVQFFENASHCITERSIKMIKMLKSKSSISD